MTLRSTELLLGIPASELASRGGASTAAEIVQQPAVFHDVAALMARRADEIEQFLAPLLELPNLRIILTGAGTSAFIGQCLAPQMLKSPGRRVEAIATTDLVAGPHTWLQPEVPTLLVSFARSGSSPESLAAVNLADQLCRSIHHIFVTCNVDGQLNQIAGGRPNVLTVLLPEATHDRGFAMTSSFTAMLYCASLLFGLIDCAKSRTALLASSVTDVLTRALPLVRELVDAQFERVVYLGSNGLRGLAQEAALKLLELTDGTVAASYDSPLGFRHGPKTIVNNRTLVVVFVSADRYTARYDLDLLKEIENDGRAGRVIALSAGAVLEPGPDRFIVAQNDTALDLELALPYIAFAQIYALLQSLALGLTPDRPSRSGTVNRVVQGVHIYPLDI